jgi:hypothetical protein
MWPYTSDELTWLTRPRAQTAPDNIRQALEQRWMTERGLPHRPANDDCGKAPAGAR